MFLIFFCIFAVDKRRKDRIDLGIPVCRVTPLTLFFFARQDTYKFNTTKMDKIAYNGKYFLGAIKFFDRNKGFGFIASNHCGLPLRLAYKQDFYVNSESFVEEEAKVEGQVVVFQILDQSNGREKATNVRCYKRTSDEDVQLALSYYGNYEKIELNDGQIANLYSSCSKPRQLVAEKVAGIIQNDKERSPETTFKHFDFFINHYKRGNSLKERYIFDKDFDKDEKQIWVNFFSIFTDEEWLEILKVYPSACRYVSDESILDSWVESLELAKPKEYLSLLEGRIRSYHDYEHFSELKDYKEIADLLPERLKEEYLTKLQLLADEMATGIIKMMPGFISTRVDLSKCLNSVLKYTPNKHDEELKTVKDNIAFKEFSATVHRYLHNPQNYLKEFSYGPSRYRDTLAYFRQHDSDRHIRIELSNAISNTFEGLDESTKIEFIEKVKPDITSSLDRYFDEGNLEAIVGTFMIFDFLDKDYKEPYLERLYPFIKEKSCGEIQKAIEKKTGLPDSFMPSYHFLISQFDEDTKKLLHDDVLVIMRTANNIELIANCSGGKKEEWLTKEEAHVMADAIVKEWNYEDFLHFFYHKFNCTEDLKLLIANYAFNLIKKFSLSENFDGSPVDDVLQKGKFAKPENIRFLEHLIDILPDGENNELWQTYISERSKMDLLVLYDKGLVSNLPLTIIEDVVNEITLDYLLADKTRWYQKPILPDSPIKKILVNANDDLFTAIAKRLAGMPLTDEEISLAVFLIELMKINKPDKLEGWDERKWENAFAQRLQAFRASLPKDSKLPVLLWAVFSQSSCSIGLLRDIFHLLPPYVQIRVVKKLFWAIAIGKFSQTAASLYEVIGGDIYPICFPLEIVFAYLKIREKDPSAELNNNVMLQLLDGREDHGEWIGIRQFVTECQGRFYTQNNIDDRQLRRRDFYNGTIGPNKNGNIVVFVPEKMINDFNELQQYNNKYKETVSELFSITFNSSEYSKNITSDGVYYFFDGTKEMELYTLSRYFNFRYKGVNRQVTFKVERNSDDLFCECRMSDKVDNYYGIPFYWCGNKPCFCPPTRFHVSSEWEAYTLLDFMRILAIPTDYPTREGKIIRFGYYTIVSSFLKSFAKFYDHLKCRHCGKLMRPCKIGNFGSKAVTEFSCDNSNCENRGSIVYLNHCFNRPKCNATIDSRDSKKCTNDQYICPECGACCSTENFRYRLSHLKTTGGIISPWLINFVNRDLGHWEKGERFCYKCGNRMQNNGNGFICPNCDTKLK